MNKCRACDIEADIGTEDVPHPIDRRIHSCIEPNEIPAGVHTGENRDALLYALERLIAAVAPFGAKHKQDRCFCQACNELRAALLFGAKLVEKLQPPTL